MNLSSTLLQGRFSHLILCYQIHFQCKLKLHIFLLTIRYWNFCMSGCMECSAVSWAEHWHMCSLATAVCRYHIQKSFKWSSPVNFQYERQNGIQLSFKTSNRGCFEFCLLLELVWDGKFHKAILLSPMPMWFLSWSDRCRSKQRCLYLPCSQNSPTAR